MLALHKKFLFKIGFTALLSVPLLGYSQKQFHQNEFSVISDNDNYALQLRDGYYTNGLFIKLNRAVVLNNSKWFNKPSIKKVVNAFEIGQRIYNPIKYDRVQPEIQDRPFAGYLAFTFEQRIFYSNNNIFEWSASAGTIGPNAYAQGVQRQYHRIIGIYDVRGWPTQIKNEANLNLKASIIKSLGEDKLEDKSFHVSGFSTAQLGNVFTNVSAGTLFGLGKIENNWNSSHWHARVSANNKLPVAHDYELYGFYQPSVTFQAYNAILQGGMFTKDKGPVTVEIKPVVFTNQFGVRYAKNRWTTALVYIKKSKEAKKQIRSENFCSMQFSYRFK